MSAWLARTSCYAAIGVAAAGVLVLSPEAHAAEPGVSENAIVLGQPAAFSGASSGLGIEYWRGMQAFVAGINEAGGINGRRLQLELCDDGYDPERAAKCAIELITTRKAFMLVNSVGTPTMERIAAQLVLWKAEHVVLFGNFTGAKIQRSMPAAPFIFNVRASYRQETAAHVSACLQSGANRIGTFVQNDGYGKDGEAGVVAAADKQGAQVLAKTYYERGTTYDADVSKQVETLRRANVDCVSTAGAYQGVGAFVRAARTAGWNVPIFALSFTGANQMATLLRKSVASDPTMNTRKVIMTQVVPHPFDLRRPLVREFRDAVAKYKPTLPPAPFDQGGYNPQDPYSFGALEGFLNTKLLAEILRRAGRDLTRVGFKTAAESAASIDVGIGAGVTATFGPVTSDADTGRHQALETVWFTTMSGTEWVAVEQSQLVPLLKAK